MKTVQIKSGHAKRIENGHRWVFSNEIAGNLRAYDPGEWVLIETQQGHRLGTGYINPNSLISVRVVDSSMTAIDKDFFSLRIKEAEARRREMYGQKSSYRLVFGESDGLPGLVVDKYGDYLVAQIMTYGMEKKSIEISEALKELHPKAIVWRRDSAMRKLEGLEILPSEVDGELPETVIADIEGLKFYVDLKDGQKTGFFLDQKENQTRVRPYVGKKRVLDCFTHLGGWALQSERFGAREVLGLDISEQAILDCRGNSRLNAMSKTEFQKTDVFDELKKLNEAREKFDVIVLDPPAFAKSKSQVKEAIKGYREINRRAAKSLHANGILITCSCSHAVDAETFRNTISQGVLSAGREALILETLTQPSDHPILLSMRETEYLKGFILRVV